MSRQTQKESQSDPDILQKILEKISDLEKSRVEEARTPTTLAEWFEQSISRIKEKELAQELLKEFRLVDEFGLKKAMALRGLNEDVIDKTLSEWRLEARISKLISKTSPKKLTSPKNKSNKSGYFYRAQYIGRYKLKNPKFSKLQQKFLDWKIMELQKLGKIRKWKGKTTALNTFPIMLVKKDRSFRFTVDFSALRGKIKCPEHTFGKISDLVQSVPREAKFFATVDLTNAYWNVPVLDKDQNKLGFTYRGQPYTWTHMPQGIPNAPYHFHRYMEWALKEVKVKYLRYFDDFLLYGITKKEVRLKLKRFTLTLKSKGFIIGSKSQTPSNQVNWCGYSLCGRSIDIPDEKVAEWRKLAKRYDGTLGQLKTIQGKLAYYHWMTQNCQNQIKALQAENKRLSQENCVNKSETLRLQKILVQGANFIRAKMKAQAFINIPAIMEEIIPRIGITRHQHQQPITQPWNTMEPFNNLAAKIRQKV